MAIENKLKVPDLLILPYPAMSLCVDVVFPSIFYSLSDPIMNVNFLRLCFESYIPKDRDPATDYLLSPIFVPDLVLAKFPPVRMMVGTNDPLRDLSYLFLQKCVQLNVDVKLTEFAHLPHGFLNYGIPIVGMHDVSH